MRSKSIYERITDLRDRISLDGDDTIYEEDYLLLDEVLDLIDNIGGEDKDDTDIETQIYDYNNTVDIYNELEAGATIKKQEKLLELYKELATVRGNMLYCYEVVDFIAYNDMKRQETQLEKEIKEIENEKII